MLHQNNLSESMAGRERPCKTRTIPVTIETPSKQATILNNPSVCSDQPAPEPHRRNDSSEAQSSTVRDLMAAVATPTALEDPPVIPVAVPA